MTQPGTVGNAIPRGRDWIPKELAELRRMIRRLGASASTTVSGGGPVGAVSYAALTALSSDGYLDPSTLTDTTGDVSAMVYDGTDPGIRIDAEGWYQAQAGAAIQSGTVSTAMSLILAVGGGVANPGAATAHLPAGYAYNTVTATLLPFFIPAAHLPAYVDFRVQGVSGYTVAGGIWVVKLT